ncbi:MAG: PIN domain-containing protein [Acidobacteria bacterium]|nr:MAG: PIN domain-containing protein [Acidobacteriota bacterium]
MSRIFWDTNVFIYLFEDIGEQGRQADSLRRAMTRRGDQLLTSALSVAELLVRPTRMGAADLCARYERAVSSVATVLVFGPGHARIFAGIRSRHAVRAPDAIQLACAAAAGVDLFVTADARLLKLQVTGITFIAPLARVPL